MSCRHASFHPTFGNGDYRTDKGGVPYWVFFRDGERSTRRPVPRIPAATPDPASPSKTRRDMSRSLGGRPVTTDQAERLICGEFNLPRFAVPLAAEFGVRYQGERVIHSGPDGIRSALFIGPELDPTDRKDTVVGGSERLTDPAPGESNKQFVAGGSRGLVYSRKQLDANDGHILFVEGLSCTVAATAAGVAAVGRPSVNAGADDAVELGRQYPDAELWFVVERDLRPSGRWPGLVGTMMLARNVARQLGRPVQVVFMPPGSKDFRDHMNKRTGPDTAPEVYVAVARDLMAKLAATAVTVDGTAAGDIPAPHIDETGQCVNLTPIQQPGKPGTRRAGQQRYRCFTCGSWTCPGCGLRKAAADYRHLVRLLRLASDPDVPRGPETPAPWPQAGDEARGHEYPRARLYVVQVEHGRWPTLNRYISRHQGEFGWVKFVAKDACHEALTKHVRFKPSERVPPLQTKSDTAHRTAQPAQPSRVPLVHLAFVAMPPGVEPDARFVPISVTDAIRLAGVVYPLIPAYNPNPTSSRFRGADFSRGWKRVKEDVITNWGKATARTFTQDEVIEMVAKTDLEVAPVEHPLGSDEDKADAPKPLVVDGPEAKVWVFAELTKKQVDRRRRTQREVVEAYNRWAAVLPERLRVGSAVEWRIRRTLWDGPEPDIAEQLDSAAACDADLREMWAAGIELPESLTFNPDAPVGDGERERLFVRMTAYAVKHHLPAPRDMADVLELKRRKRELAAVVRWERREKRFERMAAMQWRLNQNLER